MPRAKGKTNGQKARGYTITWLRRVAQRKLAPAEFLMDIMDGTSKLLDEFDTEEKKALLRIDAAKAVLPYCHPKLQNINIQQLGGGDEGPDDKARLSAPDRLTAELYERAKGQNIKALGKD
jgi:hypothetical protein